jgi:hypothetical protein
MEFSHSQEPSDVSVPEAATLYVDLRGQLPYIRERGWEASIPQSAMEFLDGRPMRFTGRYGGRKITLDVEATSGNSFRMSLYDESNGEGSETIINDAPDSYLFGELKRLGIIERDDRRNLRAASGCHLGSSRPGVLF